MQTEAERKVLEWAETYAQAEPLSPKEVPGYNAFGLRLDVPSKESFAELTHDPETLTVIRLLIMSYGVLLLRFLDEETPFALPFPTSPAGLLSPNYSQAFHVDIQGDKVRPDESHYYDPSCWSYGCHGLYQNPTTRGRQARTIFATRQCAIKAMRAAAKNHPVLSRAIKHKGSLIPKLLAWNETMIKAPSLATEAATQTVFAHTKDAIVIDWADPELAKGGAMVLWDAGEENDPNKIIVHGRWNTPQVSLPNDESLNLQRFKL